MNGGSNMTGKERYKIGKAKAYNEAVNWSLDFNNNVYYWSDLTYYSMYFHKQGKRYGLLKEFHENAIC